ncbi:hypothetical protein CHINAEXTREME_05200 [Halobiforma lacisalsi AJ5]|uniref:Uncharacterized protein n=1 Tax=Natronobacterium lacisalsi AJ5 TaxID=358396 RepID=M0LKA7_NATLA|nr:hypothetical protein CHINAEXTREME_05200 [Halobiforma lacisalsi AJ5]EMA34037.1 hypothetical protein C445_08467 [Halobiforma lacisalsi AJ5]
MERLRQAVVDLEDHRRAVGLEGRSRTARDGGCRALDVDPDRVGGGRDTLPSSPSPPSLPLSASESSRRTRTDRTSATDAPNRRALSPSNADSSGFVDR